MIPIYWGIFIPNKGGVLDKVVIWQHITFGFKTEYPEFLHGKFVENIKIVGYGNDSKNEAYLVELPEWTKKYYHKTTKPHITLSTCWSGKPVDSAKLDFSPIESTIEYGVFGYFNGGSIPVLH